MKQTSSALATDKSYTATRRGVRSELVGALMLRGVHNYVTLPLQTGSKMLVEKDTLQLMARNGVVIYFIILFFSFYTSTKASCECV